MLGVLLFKLNNGLERKVKIQYKYMVVFLLLNFVWISLCWITGYEQLAVIPPILVVVYESLQKPMYNEKMAFKQILVLTTSATVGTLLYFSNRFMDCSYFIKYDIDAYFVKNCWGTYSSSLCISITSARIS